MPALQFTIDKQSPIPIYHQLQGEIRQRILGGDLVPNERLPSENELSEQLDISPMTVRQAMGELVNDGLVYRERGRGTFVSPRPPSNLEHQLTRLSSFSEDMRARDLRPESRILVFEPVPASTTIAEALDVDEGDDVLRIKRARLAEGQPVGIHDTYVRDVPLQRQELEAAGSLYTVFAQHNVTLAEGKEVFKAITADEELSQHLGVSVGAPLLQVTRTTVDIEGRPVEYVIATYRAELYEYTVRLKR